MKRNDKNAAVFLLFGQSNAVGHGLPMEEADKITAPLAHVFGLKRSKNQAYDHEQLYWDSYSSAGMNLAEEQDDTYSVANCLAALWEKAVDAGNELPDLYLVHIAVGAEGVTEKYMWFPDRAPVLMPGRLGTVNISLHPFTTHILELVGKSMEQAGLTPYYLLHWRGGEEEMTVPLEELRNCLEAIYTRMFEEDCTALGTRIPIRLHRILADKRALFFDPTGAAGESLACINRVFEALAQKNEHISVYDPRRFPGYSTEKEHYGIFLGDEVHFTREVNEWIAADILGEFVSLLSADCAE